VAKNKPRKSEARKPGKKTGTKQPEQRQAAEARPISAWRRHWPRFLLAIPLLAVLWVPFYNRVEPELGGIPFFHWYQLAWILLGAAVVLLVYVIETRITHAIPKTKDPLDTTGTPGDVL
jgi:hypothetical protein